jgi:hypothetical protein
MLWELFFTMPSANFLGVSLCIFTNASQAEPAENQRQKCRRAGLSAVSFAPLRSAKGCRFYPHASTTK